MRRDGDQFRPQTEVDVEPGATDQEIEAMLTAARRHDGGGAIAARVEPRRAGMQMKRGMRGHAVPGFDR